MDYNTAIKTLNGKLAKKVENNTQLLGVSKGVSLVLHQTAVLQFLDNGKIVVSSGGYESNVTKDRINAFLPESFPYQVVTRQRSFKWQKKGTSETLPFIDGQTFTQNKKGDWKGSN